MKLKVNWKYILRFKLRIDRTPGKGPWGDCHLYIGAINAEGYGYLGIKQQSGKALTIKAHKLIYLLAFGSVPNGKELSHTCHMPACCNLDHIVVETHKQNMQRSAKAGRLLWKPTHPFRKNPRLLIKSRARGNAHGSKTHPEAFINRPSGDKHGLRLHPERVATGSRHGSKTHPEKIPKGKQHYTYLHPDLITKGESIGNSKLTNTKVLEIRSKYTSRKFTQTKLASMYKVSIGLISMIIHRKIWKHI